MKFLKRSVCWLALGGLMCNTVCLSVSAEAVRTQELQLRAGWNSVFLEVQPADADPARVFGGLPIEIAATFFAQTRPAPYIKNPGDAPWREEGWGVWYGPSRPDAFLSSLHSVKANQPYLIFASADCDWKVTGAVTVRLLRWQPDSYNFLGFGLDPAAPPTFAKFFAPSRAHKNQAIYQLVNGVWTPVRDPASQRMRSGEAYWVYCAGGSEYQGPVQARVSGGVLDLGAVASDGRLELVNASGAPMQLIVETVSGTASLKLAYLKEDVSKLERTFPALPSRLELPTMAAGGSEFLRLVPRRGAMTSSKESTLLRISNNEGVQVWVPVRAERAQ